MEHLSANGATETFLSGRITDSNGVPMACKILLFTNRKVSSFVIVYRVDGVVEKFKLDKSCPFGYVSMDESGRIPPS